MKEVIKKTKVLSKDICNKQSSSSQECYKCGDVYTRGHTKKCKAIDKTCFICGKDGHLSKVCRSKEIKNQGLKIIIKEAK